ncbi:MAG TPA: GNAT family protein [Planctomycetota bacterium]|nr:GNAT family protein [Planctomycetota bacterium]
MIETARLRGVRIEPAHRELLSSALYGDPRVMATLGGALLEGQALEAAVRRGVDHWTEHGFGTWLFFSADDERFVGVGGMRFFDLPEEPARVPGLIYHIAADAWGVGHATEIAACSLRVGFEALDFEAISSWTLPSNGASRRVMEKCGMSFVRESEFAGLAHHFFRITRARWQASRGA